MKPRTAILFSGVLWLLIGISLLYKGLHFFSEALESKNCSLFYRQEWLGLAFLIGFLKGRFIFTKTVKRVVSRIYSLPLPFRFGSIYPLSYWAIIGGMALLGMSMKYFSVPLDIRGFIDVAVGFALLNGATYYFQAASPQRS